MEIYTILAIIILQVIILFTFYLILRHNKDPRGFTENHSNL